MNISRVMQFCESTDQGLNPSAHPALKVRYHQIRRQLDQAIATANNWPADMAQWPKTLTAPIHLETTSIKSAWRELKAFVNTTRGHLFPGINLS